MAIGLDRLLEAVWKDEHQETAKERLTKEQVIELCNQALFDNEATAVLHPHLMDNNGNRVAIPCISLVAHFHKILFSAKSFYPLSGEEYQPFVFNGNTADCEPITQEAFIYMMRKELALSTLPSHEIVENTPIINQLIRRMRKLDDKRDLTIDLERIFNDETLSLEFRLQIAEWFVHYPISNEFYCTNCDTLSLGSLTKSFLTQKDWIKNVARNKNLTVRLIADLCSKKEYLPIVKESDTIKTESLLQALIIVNKAELDISDFYGDPMDRQKDQDFWKNEIKSVLKKLREENPDILELPDDWIIELYRS